MNAPSLNSNSVAASSERHPLEQLADEFLQLHRAGEKPTVAEYATRHPELAKEIREVFPTLLALEQAGPSVQGSFGLLGDPNSPTKTPPRVGDYQLLREIGRGAMGVVYEAQQQSLDRRVALKILPWHASADKLAVERFRREAKAAARLHHTNIVPVFEVGQEEEVCFYAMQFIQGQSLDKVIVELRRLRHDGRVDADELATERQPTVQNLAFSLHDDAFASGLEAKRSTVKFPPTEPPKPDVVSPETIRLSDGSTVQNEPSHISIAESGKEHYFRSIARVGQQVAEALAYAHGRGVIHRDIKPSNVLLDAAGVAWVTDFGLAKMEDVGITRPGDILGTLRYMAPERFQGECDVTSDVYALGVTLYEMLALRPPHEAPQRAELIAQITQRDPLPLRLVDSRIPRDLELIVLKAMDREPRHRYATAAALGEDLRRFLADEPILGRRISAWERFARWMRHNRLLAASSIGLIVALSLMVVFATAAGVSFRALAQKEHDARVDTTSSLYRSQRAEVIATRLARREGYRTHIWPVLNKARQLDTEAVNKDELRAEAIQAMGDFAGLEPRTLQGFPAEVTSLAVTPKANLIAVGLANGGLQWHNALTGEVVAKRSEHFAAVTRLSFMQDGTLLSGDTRGVVRSWVRKQDDVWETNTLGDVRAAALALRGALPDRMLVAYKPDYGGTLLHIDNLQTHRQARVDPGRPITAAAFNGGGGMLAAVGGDDIFVWHSESGGLIKRTTCKHGPLTGVSFSHDGQLLLVTGEQGLAVFDLPELRQQTFTRTEQAVAGAFSQDDRTLAFASQTRRVALWSVAGNYEQAALSLPGWKDIHTVVYGGEDRLLAAADADSVRIWNLTGTAERLNLAGHTSGVNAVGFNAAGTRLFSASKDRKLTVWDTTSGKLVGITSLSDNMRAAAFNADGRYLAGGDAAGKLAIFDTADDLKPILNVKHSLGGIQSLAFSTDQKYFIAAGKNGLMLWKVRSEPDENDKPRIALDEGQQLDDADASAMVISPDSQLLAWLDRDGRIGVITLDQRARWPTSAPRALSGRHNLAFTSDSRHLLLVDTKNQLVQWDVLGDREVATLGEPGEIRGSNLAASADGRFVAVDAEPLRMGVWDLAAKKQFFMFREERSAVSATAWSADGKLLAFGLQDGQVAIWNLPALRKELGTIELDWKDEPLEKAAAALSPLEALSVALDKDPKNPTLLLRRAGLHAEKGNNANALADLSTALEADEKNEAALVARSNLYARLAKWAEAAADSRKATELNPDLPRHWAATAILLAHAGETQQYHDHCEKMAEKFSAAADPKVAHMIARSALLMPEAVDVKLLPRRAIEDAVAGFGSSPLSRAEGYTTLALAEVRANRPNEAFSLIRRAQEDPKFSKTPAVQAFSFLVQAMAEHAVGKRTIARESLKASKAFVGGIPAAPTGGDYVVNNELRLAIETLDAEVARVLNK